MFLAKIFVDQTFCRGNASKKNVKLGLLAEPHLTPPPLNFGPVIRWKKSLTQNDQHVLKHESMWNNFFLPIITPFCFQFNLKKDYLNYKILLMYFTSFRGIKGARSIMKFSLLYFMLKSIKEKKVWEVFFFHPKFLST